MKFLDSLKQAERPNRNIVIPDIKCFSPKEGDLMRGRNPVDYAVALCEAGAPVLSVVTEEKEFHGSLSMLKAITDAVKVPVLRKDFIHTREELIETAKAGAAAILLMCSCLEREELKSLYYQALELGLDPFVETHRAEDFELVRELGARLVGINNRDILVLERDEGDVSNTEGLAGLAPGDAFLVTESSIKNPDEVRRAIAAGANAALVGTAILQAENTRAFYKMLCRGISLKVCGLMNEADIDLCVGLGTERIGLVTEYPVEVPWNLSRDRAAQLRKCIPAGYKSVMVTGGATEDIIARARLVRPDFVQLHYKENAEQTAVIAEVLHKEGIGVIAKFPAKDSERLEMFGTTDVKQITEKYCAAGADELLLDPRGADNASQRYLQADTGLVRLVDGYSTIPVILAGGIDADCLAEKLEESGVTYVDVMNASEDAPGRKNLLKISSMLDILNNI